MGLDIFSYEKIKPFESIGLTGKFWTIHIETLINTWIAMGVLFALVIVARFFLKKPQGLVSFSLEKAIGAFVTMCRESFHGDNFDYFSFISSLFLFTLFNCLVGLLPYCDEATKDLNTTLALGAASFLYVQSKKISVHGIWGYCKEFTEPFFLLAPIHIVGELAKIASMSFRLFGNILGGGIIFVMVVGILSEYKIYFLSYAAIVALLALVFLATGVVSRRSFFGKLINLLLNILFLITWLQVFFGIFEGLIQSFVITMLTMTYLSIGTQHEDECPGKREEKGNETMVTA